MYKKDDTTWIIPEFYQQRNGAPITCNSHDFIPSGEGFYDHPHVANGTVNIVGDWEFLLPSSGAKCEYKNTGHNSTGTLSCGQSNQKFDCAVDMANPALVGADLDCEDGRLRRPVFTCPLASDV